MSRRSADEQRFDFDLGLGLTEPEDDTTAEDERPPEHANVVLSAAELRARLASLRVVARQATATRDHAAPPPAPRVASPAAGDGLVDEGDAETRLRDNDATGAQAPAEATSLSIAQFYERMRRALAGEFSADVWVLGEIRSVRESRGHHYLELADHGAPASGRDAGETLEVVCWARDWPRVARELASVDLRLEMGQVVRVRGRVSVWGGRIRFTLHSLDIEAMLGQIAQARRKLLHALQLEGLLEANKKWAVPLVPLRIGLVTSQSSEAHQDFVSQLEASGFAFQVRLEPSFVQGPEAPGQLAGALRRLETFEPDLAVIVRGGGGRSDLAAFDSEEVARAVANASFPIWAGIGHTGDRSVVDEIAHSAFITPTACGEAVVARVASYWGDIQQKTRLLCTLATARLSTAQQRLEEAERTVRRGTRHQLVVHAKELERSRANLLRATEGCLRQATTQLAGARRRVALGARRASDRPAADLERCNQVLRAYDPARQLARGWTLTRDDEGHIVKSISELAVRDRLHTRFVDGEAQSVVVELDHSGAASSERNSDD